MRQLKYVSPALVNKNIFSLAKSIIPILSVILLLTTQSFKVLDIKAKNPHPLLIDIADLLDKNGIDVVQDWSSNVIIKRPVLAPLAKWNEKYKLIAQNNEQWVKEFEEGYMGGIAAIKNNENANSFIDQWNAESEEKRIFISFTKKDYEIANKIKKVLESKGYLVFVYLNEDLVPGQTAKEAGQIMKTAGQHLILDTRNARLSSGVILESQIQETFYHPNLPIIKIYGRDDCSRTSQCRKELGENNIKFTYINIDENSEANSFVMKNSMYLDENDLPLITVDGKCIKATFNSHFSKDFENIIKNDNQIKIEYPNSFKVNSFYGRNNINNNSNFRSDDIPPKNSCPPIQK